MRTRLRGLYTSLPPVYWTVWVGTLVNRAGAFVAPVLTYYLTDKRNLSLTTAGLVVASWGVGAVSASLVGGMLADRLGRRATMALSLFGGASMMLVLSQASSLVTITIATMLTGFVGDLYRPAVSAFVADVVPVEQRQRAYNILYWAINLGFSIAPVAAGIVATFSYRALFLGDALTSVVFGAIILARVPESHPDLANRSAASAREVLRDRVFVRFWFCSLILSFVMFQMMTPLSGWMESQGHGPGAYGAVLSVNGIAIVLLQPFLGEYVKPWKPRNVCALAAVFVGIGFSLHGASGLLVMHGVAVGVWTIGEMLNASVSSVFVANRAPPLLRGRYQGIYAMSWGVAGVLAPIAGPHILAIHPALLWGGCLVLGLVAAIGYRSLPDD
ncbi:MAG: MFS transporter [Kofleriaceae bacterium]